MATAGAAPTQRRQRFDPVDVPALADMVGTAFGRLVSDHYAATPEEFLRLVVVPPHPLLPVVSCLAHAPSRLRSRGRGTLLDRLRQSPMTRDTRLLLEMAWTLYKLFRRRALPYGEHPTVDDDEVPVRLTRAAARYLRPRGVTVAVDMSSATARRETAARCLRALWQAMADRSCVVWFDNFYRRRFMRTPYRTDASLNCTVVAVLVLPPPADGAPPGCPPTRAGPHTGSCGRGATRRRRRWWPTSAGGSWTCLPASAGIPTDPRTSACPWICPAGGSSRCPGARTRWPTTSSPVRWG
jgi:hypothetical protein